MVEEDHLVVMEEEVEAEVEAEEVGHHYPVHCPVHAAAVHLVVVVEKTVVAVAVVVT